MCFNTADLEIVDSLTPGVSPNLSREDVGVLQDLLQVDPNNIVARAKLLAHHALNYGSSVSENYIPGSKAAQYSAAARFPHIIWFIENAPGCLFAGDRSMYVSKAYDIERYTQAVNAWLKVTKRGSAQISVNAAMHIMPHDADLARALLNKVLRKDASNVWARAILLHADSREISFSTNLSKSRKSKLRSLKYLSDRSKNCDQLSYVAIGLAATKMSSRTWQRLRRAVAADTNNIETRIKLLAYTFRRRYRDNLIFCNPDIAQERFHQMCWAVSNIPFSDFVGSPWARAVDEAFFSRDYQFIKGLWTTLLTKYPDHPRIMINASRFLVHADLEEAQMLMKRLIKLEPKNAEAKEILKHYKKLQRIGEEPYPY